MADDIDLSIRELAEQAGKDAKAFLYGLKDPMPPLMRALFTLRAVTPCQVGYFGSSTIQGNNAATAAERVVNILTGMMQRAYPNQINADETTVQTFSSATKQTVAGIHGYNAGIGGTGTGNYLTDAMIARANNDLGINVRFHLATANDFRNSVNPATTKSNVQSWLTKFKSGQPGPAVDILLQSYQPWDQIGTYPASEYARVLREIANDPANNGTVYFFDISSAFASLGVPPTVTYGNDILDIVDTDNLHMNGKGHLYAAEILRVALGIPVENTPVAILPNGGTIRTGEQPKKSFVVNRTT